MPEDQSMPLTEDPAELYRRIAHQINREDLLIDARLTWMLTLNGFLFAALSLTRTDSTQIALHVVTWIVPLLGFVVSVAGWLGVTAAQRQLTYLKGLWKHPSALTPRPFGGDDSYCLGMLAAQTPAIALSVAWLLVVLFQLAGLSHGGRNLGHQQRKEETTCECNVRHGPLRR